MRRAFAGLRAARIRPDKGVRIALAAAGIVVLAACAPTDTRTGSADIALPSIEATTTTAAPTTAPATTTATTAPPTTAPPTTAAPTTAAPTTAVPRPRAVPKPTTRPLPTPVPTPVPTPKPTPKPSPTRTVAPAPSCDPNYSGQCLKDGIGDYDCSSGSGNGPNYVYGTVRVVGSDPFGLDRDGDGIGCEKG